MKKMPRIFIRIEGHTDNIGTSSKNKKLSQNRAQTVAAYLIAKGIDKENIETISYGDTLPKADNTTETGRAMNRRVEIKPLR